MMDIREPVRSAFASLKANKLRTVLTTLGIVIGVSAIVTISSLIQGFKGSVLSLMEKGGSNSLVVAPVTSSDMTSEKFKKIKSTDITMNDMRALERALPQVIIGINPYINSGGTVKYKGGSYSMSIGMRPDTWLDDGPLEVVMGRNFVPADMRLKSKVAIIGWRLIRRLGIKGNPIGQFISYRGMDLEIIGVLKEIGASMFSDPDDVLMIPLTTGMAILPDNQRRQLSIEVRHDPNLITDDVEEMVRDALRRIHGLKSNDVEGFKIITSKREIANFNTMAAAITGIASGMISIALVVAGIGVMNIMLVSVTERTYEIGLRKAVGATRRHIMQQFLVEAAVLCLLGGAMGILLGFAVGSTVSKIVFDQIRVIPMWVLVAGFGVPAAMGIVFGYYPAAKASKLDPIESMRYE